MRTRIVLVDDHPIVRSGLHTLLAADPRLEVVGEAASGEEALAVVHSLGANSALPDLILMDLQLGAGITGIETTARLRAEHPGLNVLILTTFDADQDVFGALEAGAIGYLLKDTATDVLTDAVIQAAQGRPTFPPDIAVRLVSRATRPDSGLSPRETEILALLPTGASNREIARRLFISESTVKGHLVHVYEKLGVDNRTAAIRAARERRLIR